MSKTAAAIDQNTLFTYLPYESFKETMVCLDNATLFRQSQHAYRILCVNLRKRPGRRSQNPTVKLWKGYEHALWLYLLASCAELGRRGYTDESPRAVFLVDFTGLPLKYPTWVGDKGLHGAHRELLLAKDPVHYAQFAQSTETNNQGEPNE
jgi:hypothetical protein